MIKKNIKYYNRGKSFTSNISINKKDIKILNVEFKENPKNKSKESIEDYYILTNKEYNQMNISNKDINKDKKELNQLKENYNTLNKELEKLTNKYNKVTIELTTEKEISENQKQQLTILQDKITDLQDKNLKTIQDLQEKQITEIKKYSNEKIKSNEIINLYKFLVLSYEKEIKEFNNKNFISRLFHHSLKLQDKEKLKENKNIEYVPKKQ